MSASAPHEAAAAPRGNAPERLAFSTDCLPERQRFDVARDAFLNPHCKVDMVFNRECAPRISADVCLAGDMTVGSLSVSSGTYERNARLARDAGGEASLYVGRKGCATFRRDGVDYHVTPGAVFLCPPDVEWKGSSPADSSMWISVMPSEMLLRALAPRQAMRPTVFAADTSEARLLAGYMDTFWRIAADADPALRQIFGAHIADIAALALGACGERRELLAGRGLKAARTQAVLRAIETNHADPRLCAGTVGLELGVTGRQVHRLMEEMPKTFSEQVLECRLNRARLLLADPASSGNTIAGIARSAGFVSPAHFSRAFRTRFGETPIAARMGRRTAVQLPALD